MGRARRVLRRVAFVAGVFAALLAVGVLLFVEAPRRNLPEAPGAGSWPPSARARELLERVVEAHGGVARWRELSALRLRIRFGGFAFQARLAEPEAVPRWIEVQLDEPRVVFEDYPEPGQRGHFSPGRVWIEDAEGSPVAALDDPRDVLLDSRRRQLWWDDLDLLYFAGYATWNYFQGPFLLLREGVESRELEPWQEDGETWRRLAVRFPETLPTHSPEQVFYYGPDLRQRRHDYRPQVFASWADAAHYSSDYRAFGGLQLPTRRRVVPRGDDNRSAEGPVLVWIDVVDAEPLK